MEGVPERMQAMSNRELPHDVASMGDAGLRFAEQFEMVRVLAAFERELFEVLDEVKAKKVEREDVRPWG